MADDDGSDLAWANRLSVVWLSVMGSIISVSAVMHCARFCIASPRKAWLTTGATFTCFLGAYFFLPYSYTADHLCVSSRCDCLRRHLPH